MRTSFELHVIQPAINACHENWDTMSDHAKGKFCLSCNKAVYDLSDYSQNEFENFLVKHKDEQICGRVKKAYLEKPFSFATPDKTPKIAWFALFMFIIFGMTLFSCHEKDHEALKLKINHALHYSDLKNNLMNEADRTTLDEVTEATIDGRSLISAEQVKAIHEVIIPKLNEPVMPDKSITFYETLNTVTITGSNEFSSCVVSGAMYYNIISVEEIAIVKDTAIAAAPQLLKNENTIIAFPNPADRNTSIKYTITENGLILLSIYSVNGQKISDILSKHDAEAGEYTEQFNTAELAAGQYVIILTNNDQKKVFRLLVAH